MVFLDWFKVSMATVVMKKKVVHRHAAHLFTGQQRPPTPAGRIARTAPPSSCTRPRPPRGWPWTPYRYVLIRGGRSCYLGTARCGCNGWSSVHVIWQLHGQAS